MSKSNGKNGKIKISPEEFIRIWQAATTIADVVKKTALNERSAAGRAHLYRKKGIPLKRLTANRRRLDVAALAALAKQTAPKPEVAKK